VCFIVHKITSEEEHAILTILYLISAKNVDIGLRLSHLTAIKLKHNELVIDNIRRFRDTTNQCFNWTIFDKDLANLAYSGLSPHLKEKLERHVFSDISQVLQSAMDCESRAKESRGITRSGDKPRN
jgi:hypothetical protein